MTGPADAPRPPAGASALRAWLVGARIHTLPAAAAPVAVGGGLAAAEGAFALLPWLAALACAALIQIGTNFSNDYYDYVQGADTAERLGFTRLTQSGMASPERVRRWMLGAFGAAVLMGGYLVARGGWPILVVGLASIAAGLAYTAGPWPLGYHGLGDLFVFLFFGLVAVAGTHYVQALRFEPWALLAGTGVGALTTAVLVVNNLRDIETDARTGKRTLAVILGAEGTRREFVLLVACAMATPAAGVVAAGWGPWTLLAFLAYPLLRRPLRAVLASRDRRELNPALAQTGRALGAYGILFGVGLAL